MLQLEEEEKLLKSSSKTVSSTERLQALLDAWTLAGCGKETAESIFREVDADSDGKLEWNNDEIREFVRIVFKRHSVVMPDWQESVWYEMYRHADLDRSNSLELDEAVNFAQHCLDVALVALGDQLVEESLARADLPVLPVAPVSPDNSKKEARAERGQRTSSVQGQRFRQTASGNSTPSPDKRDGRTSSLARQGSSPLRQRSRVEDGQRATTPGARFRQAAGAVANATTFVRTAKGEEGLAAAQGQPRPGLRNPPVPGGTPVPARASLGARRTASNRPVPAQPGAAAGDPTSPLQASRRAVSPRTVVVQQVSPRAVPQQAAPPAIEGFRTTPSAPSARDASPRQGVLGSPASSTGTGRGVAQLVPRVELQQPVASAWASVSAQPAHLKRPQQQQPGQPPVAVVLNSTPRLSRDASPRFAQYGQEPSAVSADMLNRAAAVPQQRQTASPTGAAFMPYKPPVRKGQGSPVTSVGSAVTTSAGSATYN